MERGPDLQPHGLHTWHLLSNHPKIPDALLHPLASLLATGALLLSRASVFRFASFLGGKENGTYYRTYSPSTALVIWIFTGCPFASTSTPSDHLPPLPHPRLAAALSGGYLPCLDTLLRRSGRGYAHGDVLLMSHLLLHRRTLRDLAQICSGMDGTRSNSSGGSNSNNSGSVLEYSHDLPWLLAYGNPRQSASLLASMARLIRRAGQKQQENSGDVVRGRGGGVGLAALGVAAPGHDEAMVVGGLASMLCNNIGAAFDWMQYRAARHPYNRSAAGASAPYSCGASSARADGGSAAGGDDPGAGDAAAGYPKGAQRLRLLLSFALAKVVPPLSSHLILQCRQLTMRTGVRGSDGRGVGDAGVRADEVSRVADSLQPLLFVLLVAQKTVWRCRDLVSKAGGREQGPAAGAAVHQRQGRVRRGQRRWG